MHVKISERHKAAAVKVLTERVYNPVFFRKLAGYGIPVGSEEEQAQMLKLASDLRMAVYQLYGQTFEEAPDSDVITAAQNFIKDAPTIKAAALVYNQMINS